MNNEKQHIKELEKIINTDLIPNDYIVSSGFVDSVMQKVDADLQKKPLLKTFIAVAASIAMIMLLGNLAIVMSQINTTVENQVLDEWASGYDSSDKSTWSEYYDIELLASSEKIK